MSSSIVQLASSPSLPVPGKFAFPPVRRGLVGSRAISVGPVEAVGIWNPRPSVGATPTSLWLVGPSEEGKVAPPSSGGHVPPIARAGESFLSGDSVALAAP